MYGYPKNEVNTHYRKAPNWFYPTSYTGCLYWLKSSDIENSHLLSGVYVRGVADRIGGVLMAGGIAEGGNASKPPLITAGWRDLISFGCKASLLSTGFLPPTGNNPRSIVVVCSHVVRYETNNLTASFFEYGSSGSGNYVELAIPSNTAKFVLKNGAVTSAAGAKSVTDMLATLDVIALTHDGTNQRLYINGALDLTTTLTYTTGTGTTLQFMRSSFGDQAMNSLLYECAVYDRALTAGEVAEMSTLLQAQYNA